MDPYITGAGIKALREKRRLTQAALAEKLNVSDKTVSKWETGKGYPDISLLEPLAAALGVSLTELLAGSAVENANVSANMLRSHFYVCPVCGNVLHSMGAAAVSCHGIILPPLEAEEAGEAIRVECVEDEYLVSVDHEMVKGHYISFLAVESCDRLQLVKLYPEGPAQARFARSGVRKVLACCNRDGLMEKKVK